MLKSNNVAKSYKYFWLVIVINLFIAIQILPLLEEELGYGTFINQMLGSFSWNTRLGELIARAVLNPSIVFNPELMVIKSIVMLVGDIAFVVLIFFTATKRVPKFNTKDSFLILITILLFIYGKVDFYVFIGIAYFGNYILPGLLFLMFYNFIIIPHLKNSLYYKHTNYASSFILTLLTTWSFGEIMFGWVFIALNFTFVYNYITSKTLNKSLLSLNIPLFIGLFLSMIGLFRGTAITLHKYSFDSETIINGINRIYTTNNLMILAIVVLLVLYFLQNKINFQKFKALFIKEYIIWLMYLSFIINVMLVNIPTGSIAYRVQTFGAMFFIVSIIAILDKVNINKYFHSFTSFILCCFILFQSLLLVYFSYGFYKARLNNEYNAIYQYGSGKTTINVVDEFPIIKPIFHIKSWQSFYDADSTAHADAFKKYLNDKYSMNILHIIPLPPYNSSK